MSVALFIGTLLFFFLGYRFYSRYLEKIYFEPIDVNATPSNSRNDGVDFYPAKSIVLFGHHFSSIAGAGPIIGPVIAAYYFGWLPVFIWLLLGAVFIGAVHDYLSLMISVREKGESISKIAKEKLSSKIGLLFGSFLWLALILVITVFAVTGAKTLVDKPQVVLPSLGLIPLAMAFGFLIYKKNFNITLGSILFISLLFLLLVGGFYLPLKIFSSQGAFLTLIIYSFLASILPVWFLLQPRDYLSTGILFLGLLAGFVGIFLAHPHLNWPAIKSVSSAGKNFSLWPMLFILVACGAISGFHSLVSSGTTSKQLAREKDGRRIAYLGMLTEGVLAVIALFSVSAGLKSVEFTGLMSGKGNWMLAFSRGFGNITSHIPFLTAPLATVFAMVMLNAFILTTLDTSVRIARFIFTEALFPQNKFLSNKYVATFLTLLPVVYLGWAGSWKKIWPVFGACNQLIAALTFLVIMGYFLRQKKPIIYLIIPAAFMLITSGAALIVKSKEFYKAGNYSLFGITVALLILVVVFLKEYFVKIGGGKEA
jgi:carbon starvation protein